MVGIAAVLPIIISSTEKQLLTIFSSGILLAFFYTADPIGLKYHALGDITIFLCFGPLLMECTSLLLTGSLYAPLLIYSFPIGLLTEAILHANNARDIKADAAAGGKILSAISIISIL
jgi:1,4-dihydroxy-2-naphthoate octaprenyltransferase